MLGIRLLHSQNNEELVDDVGRLNQITLIKKEIKVTKHFYN